VLIQGSLVQTLPRVVLVQLEWSPVNGHSCLIHRCDAFVHDRAARASVQAGGRQDTPVYLLRDLKPGHCVPGPAIVLDDISTVVVEPACTARVTPAGDLRVDVGTAAAGTPREPTECDPIQLAIFSHRCEPRAAGACERGARAAQRA